MPLSLTECKILWFNLRVTSPRYLHIELHQLGRNYAHIVNITVDALWLAPAPSSEGL
jgi:hypothetical protein